MSTKAVEVGSKTDLVKLLVAVVLLIAGSVAFYVYSEYALYMRILALMAVAAVALFLLIQTDRGRRSLGFIRDARTEVRKVVWPTRAETTQTTLVVVVMVLVVAIILWIMDSFLLWAVKLLTGQGG